MALKIHWYAPLQTKGFLKIVELVVAILCLSLAASYQFSSSSSCITTFQNYTASVDTSYPLFMYNVKNESLIIPIITPTSATPINTATRIGAFQNALIGQGAQFFVTWSVATMMYCVGALAVYMVVTANEELERVMDLLVYADLFFHVVWVFFWFVVSVDWAVQYNNLIGAVKVVLDANCPMPIQNTYTYTSTAQAGVSVVFGFLSIFLWGINIFWVVIDTPWYIQRKGNSDSYDATP